MLIIFLFILNQTEFRLGSKREENLQYDHIPFSLNRKRNILLRVYVEHPRKCYTCTCYVYTHIYIMCIHKYIMYIHKYIICIHIYIMLYMHVVCIFIYFMYIHAYTRIYYAYTHICYVQIYIFIYTLPTLRKMDF